MNQVVRLGSLVAAAAFLQAAVVGCNGRQEQETSKQQHVFAPAPKEKAVKIPLASIYATWRQEGLRRIPNDEAHTRDLNALLGGDGKGPTNVLLVRGKDIGEALKTTRWAYTVDWGGDVPVPPEGRRPEPASLWLAAYLGTNSSVPPAWQLVSAERRGNVVRLTVRRPARDKTTRDLRRYFVWVPLGELAAGTYTVELHDAGLGPILKRYVTVEKK